MTLILACLTKDCIVQVSDRRLTSVDKAGSFLVIADEASNKALFLDSSWVIGYTGLAMLDGMRADLWLADKLAQTSGS